MIGCLIIHGYTGGPYELQPLVDYLRNQTNWEIAVPTLPGHGKNLQLINPCYMKWLQKAEESLHLLKAKYDTVYVIGFSMGGMIASYLAGKFKVDKLVLLATSGKYIALKRMTLDIGKFITDSMTGKMRDHYFYLWFKKKRGKVPLKAYVEFFKLVKYTRTYLKKIKSPVLIAQGRQDGVVPYSALTYLDREITSETKEIILFEQSNHLICLGKDKDTLNEIIYEFLNDELPHKQLS